jgi:hypothetical protein
MTDDELDALERDDAWDWDSAETHPPVQVRRTNVYVSFSYDEFQRIGSAAERIRERVTDFIRDAALERAARHLSTTDPPSTESTATTQQQDEASTTAAAEDAPRLILV